MNKKTPEWWKPNRLINNEPLKTPILLWFPRWKKQARFIPAAISNTSASPNLVLKLYWVLTGGLQQRSPLRWRRRSTPLATHTALCRLKATSKGRDESAKGWAMPNIRTRFAYSDFPIDRRAIGSFADHLADKRGGLNWLADEFDNVLWTASTITHAKNERARRGERGGNPLEDIAITKREISPVLYFYILHLLDLHKSWNSPVSDFTGIWWEGQRSRWMWWNIPATLEQMEAERGKKWLLLAQVEGKTGRKGWKKEDKDELNVCFMHILISWNVIYLWGLTVNSILRVTRLVCLNSSCHSLNIGWYWCWSNPVLHFRSILSQTISLHSKADGF